MKGCNQRKNLVGVKSGKVFFFIRKRELIKSGKSNRNQNACKYAYYQQIILQVMICYCLKLCMFTGAIIRNGISLSQL